MRFVTVLALWLLPSLAAAQPFEIVARFPAAAVSPAGALIQVPDGTLYGAAAGGIYKVTSGGVVTTAATFDGTGYGALLRGSDGALYGATRADGDEGRGTIFRFDPVTGERRVLRDLRKANDGKDPFGGLVELGGQLYGVTAGPEFSDVDPGTIFGIDPATGALRTLYEFRQSPRGTRWLPRGPLTRGVDGGLYGFAQGGGSNGAKTLYRFDPASPDAGIVIVHEFPAPDGGSGPLAAADGLLYGSTVVGGAEHAGTIFSFDPVTGAFAELYSLAPSNGTDGKYPGPVALGPDGHLYGTTREGHAGAEPTLFRLRRFAGGAVAYETLRVFDPPVTGRPDADAVLMAAADGFIYGSTPTGGPFNDGTLFRFDPLAAGPPSNLLQFEVLHAFPRAPTAPSPPVLAPDGFLYGTTRFGDTTGAGSVYRLNASTGAVAIVGSLPALSSTDAVYSALVLGADGMLYATATSGDTDRIVRVDPATGHVSTAIESVPSLGFSASLNPGLVRTPTGALYGTWQSSGAVWVYRFDPQTNSTRDLAVFSQGGSRWGIQALGLLAADDGRLYLTMRTTDTEGAAPIQTELYRLIVATGRWELVKNVPDALGSPPVRGPGDTVYLTSSRGIISVNTTTGETTTACDVAPVPLSVAPDGTLHGWVWRGGSYPLALPLHHARCNPITHATEVTMLPGVGFPHDILVPIGGLMYGVSDRTVFRLASAAPLPPLDSDGDGLPNSWETAWGLDPLNATGGAGAGDDPDHDGRTNAQELAAGTHPRGFVTRYFAEGATGSFFQTRIDIGNPNLTQPAIVLLRFLTDAGVTVTHDLVVTPRSHVQLDPATLAGLASANFSTIVESDAPIGVDRTMTWDASGYGSHIDTGVASPSSTWYFAEGSTSGEFSLFYLLQNPQATAVTATVRYLRPFGQPPIERTYTLAPSSRTTIVVDAEGPELASTDVSAVITADAPIVAERAMYFNRPGQPFAAGHESAGVAAPALEWFLAEGATGDFFDLFVLLSNPNATAADVEVEYLLAGGGTLTTSRTVPANSRVTIWVDDEELPAGSGQRPLANAAVSTRVRSLNGVPIVVERTMWWPGPALTSNFWYEAHNSPGTTTTATRWVMGGGEANGPTAAATYVLLANPGSTAGRVRVRRLMDDGRSDDYIDYDVPAQSRTNVSFGGDSGQASQRFAILVESLGPTPVPIVVERATYASPGGVTWAAGGASLASPLP